MLLGVKDSEMYMKIFVQRVPSKPLYLQPHHARVERASQRRQLARLSLYVHDQVMSTATGQQREMSEHVVGFSVPVNVLLVAGGLIHCVVVVSA